MRDPARCLRGDRLLAGGWMGADIVRQLETAAAGRAGEFAGRRAVEDFDRLVAVRTADVEGFGLSGQRQPESRRGSAVESRSPFRNLDSLTAADKEVDILLARRGVAGAGLKRQLVASGREVHVRLPGRLERRDDRVILLHQDLEFATRRPGDDQAALVGLRQFEILLGDLSQHGLGFRVRNCRLEEGDRLRFVVQTQEAMSQQIGEAGKRA